MNRYLKTILFVVLFSTPLFVGASEPIVVYLTWEKNPESTMIIRWITREDDQPQIDLVEFQSGKSLNQSWQQKPASHSTLPETNNKLLLYSAELDSLAPDTSYFFRIGTMEKPFKFKTAPDSLDHPIRFMVAGDLYHDEIKIIDAMNELAAKYDPLFALFGGDLAYSISNKKQRDRIERWLDWLISWQNKMITPDGRSVPIIPAIGNHEVFGGFNQTPGKAPLFYALFPFPGKQGANLLDFSKYMTLFVLDSGHTHPVEGAQTEWLKKELETRNNIPNKFALYHVPAFPSVRNYHVDPAEQIRKNWVPLFEKYGLHTAFENHDHSYKRSYPIKENRVDPEGVLYMGDGGYGVKKPRKPLAPNEIWYIAASAAERNFLIVTIDQHQRTYFAINGNGQRFDQFIQQIPLAPTEKKPIYIEMPVLVP